MKQFYLLLLMLLVSIVAMGGPVTPDEARQKITKFMNPRRANAISESSLKLVATSHYQVQKETMAASYYVFNVGEGQGFVIAGADDRVPAVLGYSSNGKFDPQNMPENMKAWLESYDDQMAYLNEHPEAAAPRKTVSGASISPLLQSEWNQGNPYNLLCPEDGGQHSVTGCVATAMAQVMYYHKWPQGDVASPGWDLPATTFKWDLMKDEYDVSDTGESADAVAELMYYCGAAVDMSYGVWESAASVYATDMIKHFGYSTAAKTVHRRSYSTEEWEGLIYNELKNARPVLYSGYSGKTEGSYSGGHEFVVDGYDDKGLFHVNWGWSGQSDGYFALSILNPYDKGTGGGSSENGFSIIQEAIIGLQPPYEGEVAASPIVYDQGLSCSSASRTSAEEDFELEFWDRIYCWENEDMEIDFACALYQGDMQVAIIGMTDVNVKAWGYLTYAHPYATFGAGITKGTYEVRPIFREKGKEEWQRVANFNNGKVILTIKDNELTVSYASHPDMIKEAVQINSCRFEGAMKECRPCTAIINWTNNGYMDETIFFLFDQAVSSYVAPGQTGDVIINFVPWESGDVNIVIAVGDKNNVVWSQIVTIEETPYQELSAVIDFDEQKGGISTRNTIGATVTFTNEGENNYNDEVKFALYQMTKIDVEEEDTYYFIADGEAITTTQQLVLPTGEEKALHVNFSNLTEEKYYGLYVYYYSRNVDPVRATGRIYYLNKPIPTVTANNASRKYGEFNPVFTYAVDIEGVLTGEPELTTIADETSSVGSYPIVVSQGSIEGEFNAVNGELTIEKAPLKITAKDYTIKQGQPLPEFEVTYDGFKNDETSEVLWKQPVIETTATSESEPGEYEITVYDAEAQNYEITYFKGKLTIEKPDYISGDVNGDGLVNVTDIVATVNYIMEKPSDGFNKEAADLNGDGEVNVTDIVKMVTIIMSGDGGSSRRAAATSSKLVIYRNNIQLKNADAYTAAQFDINLSDGQSISNVVLNVSSDHSLYWKMVAVNTYRVVVYSMTNAAFRANSDNLFTVFMTGSQNATISNELLIKADGTTGIDAIRTEAENGNVYDLNGRQVKNPRKGLYIINGRKVIVK
jgi:hypothetical protein